ncbi:MULTISPECIES: VOC family protein [unclassified Crossiella]|uniref:VOC family protein n=1 Tax=unclassified Crossiella TaxID=2620835 RepID=UPI002000288F|nr:MULTISPECIES: VOC family protein [unclassified Crossiella]MCK2243466.1 VOC family protein [Crossiella sp. S99.2]MCK2257324.1 VOC family protein [Crossiella sp. S99.1]
MASVLRNVNFDCADLFALAGFWSQVTGNPVRSEDGPDETEVWVSMPEGPDLYFQQVAEPKTIKNRVHVCLEPLIPRDEEVERLLGIGATMVTDMREPDGTGWAVLADPEGNEFCVLRSAAERAVTA